MAAERITLHGQCGAWDRISSWWHRGKPQVLQDPNFSRWKISPVGTHTNNSKRLLNGHPLSHFVSYPWVLLCPHYMPYKIMAFAILSDTSRNVTAISAILTSMQDTQNSKKSKEGFKVTKQFEV